MPTVTITLFTTRDCPHCAAGRLFLTERGVDFVERDVLADSIALQDMLFMLGRTEVPALCGGYQASIGFDPPRWLEVLEHVREIRRRDPMRLPAQFGEDPLKL
jgi:glutaredoxin